MIEVHSTKSFFNLPCGHAQYFDLEADGSPGECASIHGYDRSVHFTFSGDIDDHGWIFPFGDLKPVKKFLEYYFDHTTVLSADDPRLPTLTPEITEPGGILNTLRVLPYGVSMEMSSLFIWEHVNAYIMNLTKERVYVSKVEMKEHDRNSGMVTADRGNALHCYLNKHMDIILPEKPRWEFEPPKQALKRLQGLI